MTPDKTLEFLRSDETIFAHRIVGNVYTIFYNLDVVHFPDDDELGQYVESLNEVLDIENKGGRFELLFTGEACVIVRYYSQS